MRDLGPGKRSTAITQINSGEGVLNEGLMSSRYDSYEGRGVPTTHQSFIYKPMKFSFFCTLAFRVRTGLRHCVARSAMTPPTALTNLSPTSRK
jgi:hypothetical protein